jgi:hypothetical protein
MVGQMLRHVHDLRAVKTLVADPGHGVQIHRLLGRKARTGGDENQQDEDRPTHENLPLKPKLGAVYMNR